MLFPSTSFVEALMEISVARLQFAHQFTCDAQLPRFKGGLWHGLFGASLHDVSESAFQCLFATDQTRRRWALRAPLQQDVRISAGSELGSVLTLFGEAVVHRDACIDALTRMGERGFGKKAGRAPATVINIAFAGVHGNSIPASWKECVTLSLHDLFSSTASEVCGIDGLRVELISPLHINVHGKLVKRPPAMDLLMHRLLGRLLQLGPDTSQFRLNVNSERVMLLDFAANVELINCQIENLRWYRYSARQNRSMPMEGMQGMLEYRAPAAQLYPWLKLAQWTHLGAKTSFGLGAVRIEPPPGINTHHSGR